MTRPAERRDIEDIARIAHVAYEHYTARIGRPPAPMNADYAAAVRDETMWIAEDGNRMVGFIVVVDADDHLLLENIAVDPAVQGRGVGRKLLALAESEASRRGYTQIYLYTNEEMTENLDYYPRKGYVESHRGEEDGYRRVFFSKALSDGSS